MGSNRMYWLLASSLFVIVINPNEVQCGGNVDSGRKGYSPNRGHCEIQVDHQLVEKTCGGETITFNVTVKSPNSGCREQKPVAEGYVHFPGYGYYKYHTTPKSWNNARMVCRNEGGHLVVFNSEAEAKFVARLPNNKYDWALIGMHDLYKEGQWTTIFDEELHTAGFAKWNPGEPTSLTADENCGVVFPNGLLGDYLCQIPRTFFCEIN